MKRISCYLLLWVMLCTLAACSKKEPPAESLYQELSGEDLPAPDPVAEAELAKALEEEDAKALDWREGILGKIPPYTEGGTILEWAVADTQAVVSLRDVTREDVEAYTQRLEDAEFLGELTVVGGVDRFMGDYIHEGQRLHINLLFTANTNEIEYSTLVITGIPL